MKPAMHIANMLDLQPARCGLRMRAHAFDAHPGSESARHPVF